MSPSGQLDRCAGADPKHSDATRISVVDGGYADNTGIGTIVDEDTAPVLSIANPVAVAESAGPVNIVVTKTGAWFTFEETRLGQGREAIYEWITKTMADERTIPMVTNKPTLIDFDMRLFLGFGLLAYSRRA